MNRRTIRQVLERTDAAALRISHEVQALNACENARGDFS